MPVAERCSMYIRIPIMYIDVPILMIVICTKFLSQFMYSKNWRNTRLDSSLIVYYNIICAARLGVQRVGFEPAIRNSKIAHRRAPTYYNNAIAVSSRLYIYEIRSAEYDQVVRRTIFTYKYYSIHLRFRR